MHDEASLQAGEKYDVMCFDYMEEFHDEHLLFIVASQVK